MPSSARYGRTRTAASNGKPACSCKRYVATHRGACPLLPLMAQHHEGPRRHVDNPVSFDEFPLQRQVRARSVERYFPTGMIQLVRNSKCHGFVMRVQKQEKVLVLCWLAFAVADFRRHAVEEHAERAHPSAVFPVLGVHSFPIRPKP